MIDTDQYEGHSTGWKRSMFFGEGYIVNDDGKKIADRVKGDKDSQLMADAPKLLAEVKRLREVIVKIDMALMDEDASHLESVELIEAILSRAGVIE